MLLAFAPASRPRAGSINAACGVPFTDSARPWRCQGRAWRSTQPAGLRRGAHGRHCGIAGRRPDGWLALAVVSRHAGHRPAVPWPAAAGSGIAPNERLSLTEGGNVRCALKTPYRDGTTHVIFEPEDFIARLAALVPKPRAHQIRYHGVFAPASPDRARVVPRTRAAVAGECGEASVTDRQRALALTW